MSAFISLKTLLENKLSKAIKMATKLPNRLCHRNAISATSHPVNDIEFFEVVEQTIKRSLYNTSIANELQNQDLGEPILKQVKFQQAACFR